MSFIPGYTTDFIGALDNFIATKRILNDVPERPDKFAISFISFFVPSNTVLSQLSRKQVSQYKELAFRYKKSTLKLMAFEKMASKRGAMMTGANEKTLLAFLEFEQTSTAAIANLSRLANQRLRGTTTNLVEYTTEVQKELLKYVEANEKMCNLMEKGQNFAIRYAKKPVQAISWIMSWALWAFLTCIRLHRKVELSVPVFFFRAVGLLVVDFPEIRRFLGAFTILIRENEFLDLEVLRLKGKLGWKEAVWYALISQHYRDAEPSSDELDLYKNPAVTSRLKGETYFALDKDYSLSNLQKSLVSTSEKDKILPNLRKATNTVLGRDYSFSDIRKLTNAAVNGDYTIPELYNQFTTAAVEDFGSLTNLGNFTISTALANRDIARYYTIPSAAINAGVAGTVNLAQRLDNGVFEYTNYNPSVSPLLTKTFDLVYDTTLPLNNAFFPGSTLSEATVIFISTILFVKGWFNSRNSEKTPLGMTARLRDEVHNENVRSDAQTTLQRLARELGLKKILDEYTIELPKTKKTGCKELDNIQEDLKSKSSLAVRNGIRLYKTHKAAFDKLEKLPETEKTFIAGLFSQLMPLSAERKKEFAKCALKAFKN